MRTVSASIRPLSFQNTPFLCAARGRGLGHGSGRLSCRGQAIVEYAIVFPILLLVTLSIIQLSHILVAKQVVNYAAFVAARAALVADSEERRQDDAEWAAAFVCSPIAGNAGVTTPDDIEIPGWHWDRREVRGVETRSTLIRERRLRLVRTDVSDCLPGSGAAREKNRVTLDPNYGEGRGLAAEVIHDFELVIPIANEVAYGLAGVLMAVEDVDDSWGAPHIRIRGHCVLAQAP